MNQTCRTRRHDNESPNEHCTESGCLDGVRDGCRTRFQVNLHFGEGSRKVSACNLIVGTVFGRGIGDCVRRIIKKLNIPAEKILLEFQPE